MLSKLMWGVAGVAGATVPLRFGAANSTQAAHFSPQEEALLEEIERAAFGALWEHTQPETGLVMDQIHPGPPQLRSVASIAATGFGLSAWCIADQRGWLRRNVAMERVRRTLRFIAQRLPHEHGFYYHFVDWATGEREWQCEVSSIDTALLLCGVLTCRQHFGDPEIQELAAQIFSRVEWKWLLHEDLILGHGWTPERGFLASRWDTFSEHMMLYLLAIGADQHRIPAAAWQAWRRPVTEFGGLRYIDDHASLFIHQYSHAWFDFRGLTDGSADYFENSIQATRAHQLFCESLANEFPHYGQGLWGLTASLSPRGYVVWGGPPRLGPVDGCVVPAAAAGSLPFLPQATLSVLRTIRRDYADLAWGRHGFVDAFHPTTGWRAANRVTINTGITLLMAENARSGFVWQTFMRNPEARLGLARAGFQNHSLV